MTTTISITRNQVPNNKRSQHTADLFGLNFPLSLEPLVYAITDEIAEEYNGGYWEFYTLSNGGFYMAPHSDSPFNVSCENGFEGQLGEFKQTTPKSSLSESALINRTPKRAPDDPYLN